MQNSSRTDLGSRQRTKALLTGIAYAFLLATSSCSPGTIGQGERASSAEAIDAATLLDKSQQPMAAAATGRVSISDDAYLPADSDRALHGVQLPHAMDNISIYETDSETLPEIARTLSMQFGIPVTLSPDTASVTEAAQTPTAPTASNISAGGVRQTISNLGLAGQNQAVDTTNTTDGTIAPPVETADTMNLHWTGPYSGLLDQIAAKFGLTYTYDGTAILISRNITRTYTLHALSSDLTLNETLSGSGINGQSSGSGSGNTSNTSQSVSSAIQSNIWQDIVKDVQSIVGGDGTIATLDQTGTITVTAPPAILQSVQSYIDQENRSLENEITVTVQVINVALNRSDTDSFDLTSAIAAFAGTAKLGNQTPGTAQASSANGTISPGVTIISGGTSAALTAISQFGNVASRTQSAVTTMNGFVAPFQLTNTRNYVSGNDITDTGAAAAGGTPVITETLTTSTVTVGYNIAILPRVDFTDDTVLLQYGISISSLNGADNGFDLFTTSDGSQTVQLANINQEAFIDNAEVPDGDTIVITGYNQDNDSSNKTGFGSAGFFGLSGNQSGAHSRQEVVILITPTVLHIAHSQIETSLN